MTQVPVTPEIQAVLESRSYAIWICPECGNQDRYPIFGRTTYCLEHDDEVGRKKRPAYVMVTLNDLELRSDA